MPLDYATPATPTPSPHANWRYALLFLLATLSLALTARAIGFDRRAQYENTHRPWYDGFGGESFSSFRAWQAWRNSWARARYATTLSAIAFIPTTVAAVRTRRQRPRTARWLCAALVIHAGVIAYFVVRWGPDFAHPAPSWGG